MGNNVVAFHGGGRGNARRVVPSRLRDARLANRLNQSELATAIGVSRQAISAFEQGEKAPEPETLARIASALKQSVSFFAAEDRAVFGESSTRFFRAFGPDTRRRNLMCDVFGKWFVQIARYFYDFVNFPNVDLPSMSPQRPSGRYTDEEIEAAAEQCRKQWGLGLGPLSNVIGLLESKGVAVCRYEFEEEKIEAFSFWNGPRPFIFLSSDKESSARARFDAAHELGHLILHRWIDADDLEDPKTLKAVEKEANRFAGALLLPRQSFPNEVYTTRLDAFVVLKRRWKVAIQAMVYRCKDLGIFDEDQITNLYKQISFRKWRTKEPLDNEIPLEQPTLLRRAAELVVSAGKKLSDQIVTEIQVSADFLAAISGVKVTFFEVPATMEFTPSLK